MREAVDIEYSDLTKYLNICVNGVPYRHMAIYIKFKNAPRTTIDSRYDKYINRQNQSTTGKL
jgi:hypothetical protein